MIAMNPPTRPNLMQASVTACLLPLLAVSASCVVTTVEKLAPDAAPRAVEKQSSWDVVLDHVQVGKLHLLEVQGPSGKVRFYHVTYPDGQQAGWIDVLGRAFRDKRIDEEGPDGTVHVGMDTMEESLRKLLELARAPRVVPSVADEVLAQR